MSLHIQYFTFSASMFTTEYAEDRGVLVQYWENADTAHTIRQSNYFLRLHDLNTAFQ